MSDAASEYFGYAVQIATFSGEFEVRRCQVSFSMDAGSPGGEDVRVITFHQIKVSGATPVDAWDEADFNYSRSGLLTWWDAIKDNYNQYFNLVKIAYYRAGPGLTPPQLPVNQSDHLIPGSSTGNAEMPPQVALTVTEKVSGSQRNWGRFYLPAPVVGAANLYGRPTGGFMTDVADATDTMYQYWKSNNVPAVVYLQALPERSPSSSDPRYVTKGTFAPRAASARSVDQLQVDDVFDVIRSRRFDRPNNRFLRDIT